MCKLAVIAVLLCALAVWRFGLPVHARGPRTLKASWYGFECAGRKTASGDIFDPYKMTAASWEFYKKKLRVTHKGFSVIVLVNDKGPSPKLFSTRTLDLSRAAFRALAPLDKGLIEVTVEVLP